jgi:hypothetical protein
VKRSSGASVIVVLLMPGVLRAAVQCADQGMVIDVVNSAGIPARDLEQATRLAARILITSGTTIIWRTSAGNLQGPITSPAMTTLNYDVRLKIADSAPSSVPNRTLAYALPSVRIGTNITIFYDRVKRVSQDVEIDSASVLGLVIAHEIGHMLLRSTKHSPTGIMKAPWTKSDIQHAAARLGEFTSLDRSIIRQCGIPELLSDAGPAKPANPRHEAVFAPE